MQRSWTEELASKIVSRLYPTISGFDSKRRDLMPTQSLSSKPSVFVESLRDPVRRGRLSLRLRREFFFFVGLLLVSLAVQVFLVIQGRSEMNDFRFILILLICGLAISDIRQQRHMVEIFDVLVAKGSTS
jgi:hypothetical protein